VAFALNLILRKPAVTEPRRAEVAPGLFWGAVTGFTSFVSHAGAPPYQVYTLPLGLTKAVFAGTSTIAFAIINAVKLVPYYALGQLNTGNLKLAAVLAVPAVIAVFAGVGLVKRMPEKLFFRLVTWALLLISLKLIWDGARGLIRPCARLYARPPHPGPLPRWGEGTIVAGGSAVFRRLSRCCPMRMSFMTVWWPGMVGSKGWPSSVCRPPGSFVA
jgi:hypothetical protein